MGHVHYASERRGLMATNNYSKITPEIQRLAEIC